MKLRFISQRSLGFFANIASIYLIAWLLIFLLPHMPDTAYNRMSGHQLMAVAGDILSLKSVRRELVDWYIMDDPDYLAGLNRHVIESFFILTPIYFLWFAAFSLFVDRFVGWVQPVPFPDRQRLLYLMRFLTAYAVGCSSFVVVYLARNALELWKSDVVYWGNLTSWLVKATYVTFIFPLSDPPYWVVPLIALLGCMTRHWLINRWPVVRGSTPAHVVGTLIFGLLLFLTVDCILHLDYDFWFMLSHSFLAAFMFMSTWILTQRVVLRMQGSSVAIDRALHTA